MGNYAPNPTSQDIYNQLATINLESVTAEQIGKLTNPVTLSADNQDALITMNTVNRATFRDSGTPMPNTQKIIQRTYTDASQDSDFFKPEPNEVWMLIGGDSLSSGGTGTVGLQIRDENDLRALLFITSVNGQEPIGDNSTGLKYPIYVSSTNWLFANITAVATSVRLSLSFVRVR